MPAAPPGPQALVLVQAAAGRTQQEDPSGAFLQMAKEANQNVKIRNLRRFAGHGPVMGPVCQESTSRASIIASNNQWHDKRCS